MSAGEKLHSMMRIDSEERQARKAPQHSGVLLNGQNTLDGEGGIGKCNIVI